MPITFMIYPEQNLILTRGEGDLVAADLFGYYEALRAHEDYARNLNEIFDLSRASGLNITGQDLKHFAATTAAYTTKGDPVKVAIIAPRDLEFALSRMYELMQSGNTIKVFRDRAEAESWMGVALD